jgi:hypothetical protein
MLHQLTLPLPIQFHPPQEEINQFDKAVPVTIIPAVTSAIVTELNDNVENSMMRELEDDGADELDGGSDSEGLDMSVCSEDLKGMGIPLVVDPDGEGSSFSSDSADGSLQHTPKDFNMALNESVIIRSIRLPVNIYPHHLSLTSWTWTSYHFKYQMRTLQSLPSIQMLRP